MYRFCPECNGGEGLRLEQDHVSCPEEHEGVVCVLEQGDRLGDFLVEVALPSGEGGYATVYRAKLAPQDASEEIYPVAALKVATGEGRGALEREAETLSYLMDGVTPGTRHIPRIFRISSGHQAPPSMGAPGVTNEYLGSAVLDLEPFYYVAIEYLPGSSLRARIDGTKGRGMDVESALRTGRQVADALDRVHAAGMIHLDVKPSNIMFDAAGEAVLIDFGIAALAGGQQNSWPGTAPYAPREQISQQYPDHRADIHALGATIFEMLTARLPYTGASATALATAVRVAGPLPLARLSPRLAYLDPALKPALDPDPDGRYDSAAALIEALDSAVSARGGRGKSMPVVGLVAGIMAVGLLLLAITLASMGAMGALAGGKAAADASPTVAALFTSPAPRPTPKAAATRRKPPSPSPLPAAVHRIAIVGPVEGAVFVGVGSNVPLSWNDPAGPLARGEHYMVELVMPDAKRVQYNVKTDSFELPVGVTGESTGRFSWQVGRYETDKTGKAVLVPGSTSRISSFWWVTPTPTPAPTSTPTPTAIATITPSIASTETSGRTRAGQP